MLWRKLFGDVSSMMTAVFVVLVLIFFKLLRFCESVEEGFKSIQKRLEKIENEIHSGKEQIEYEIHSGNKTLEEINRDIRYSPLRSIDETLGRIESNSRRKMNE